MSVSNWDLSGPDQQNVAPGSSSNFANARLAFTVSSSSVAAKRDRSPAVLPQVVHPLPLVHSVPERLDLKEHGQERFAQPLSSLVA